MPRNTLSDLRNALFQTLENLVNPEGELSALDMDKAQKITTLAKVILDTGMAEMKYQKQKSSMNAPDNIAFFEAAPNAEIKKIETRKPANYNILPPE